MTRRKQKAETRVSFYLPKPQPGSRLQVVTSLMAIASAVVVALGVTSYVKTLLTAIAGAILPICVRQNHNGPDYWRTRRANHLKGVDTVSHYLPSFLYSTVVINNSH